MEPEKGTSGSEPGPKTLHNLALCSSLLRLRNFTRCRQFALQISRSDPKISDTADRILAIADVHIAAGRRLSNNQFDWYSILQLRRLNSGNHQLIRNQFKRLAHLLNPNRNKYALANEAFLLVRDAWRVLSDPEKRAKYDQAIGNVNVGEPKASFWTVCPYCWGLFEYEKIYEDCSLRCQKCRKVFHAITVPPPEKDMLVTGKEQYYCYCAHIPLRYLQSQHSINTSKHWGMADRSNNESVFVDFPDHDVGNLSKNFGIGEDARVFHPEQAGNEGLHGDLGNGKRRMRVKTVARNTKKMTGSRMRYQGRISPNLDAEDGYMKFSEEEADVFVSVQCAK